MYQKASEKILPFQNVYLLRESEQGMHKKVVQYPAKHEIKEHYAVIETIIREIQTNGPAGLLHARLMSKILKRPVRIWHNERVLYSLGSRNGKLPVDVEYNTSMSGVGHWSLRGGKDPKSKTGSSNDCLYEAVAVQTGLEVSELRRRVAKAVRNSVAVAAMILAAVMRGDAFKLIGGARYTGSSPRDAQRLLDASQNGACHPEGRSGHPRGHASNPSASGRSEDSVEMYSYSRWRSGFLSRDDQDLVCHYTLITGQARDLMDRLNRGQFKVAEHINRRYLDYDALPMAQIWSQGQREGSPSDFQTVCLVGKHFLGRQNDEYADLFILTFYPII